MNDESADLTTVYMVGYEKGKDKARAEVGELRAALKQLLANPYPLTFTGDPLSHREGRARHEAAMRAARAALAATEGES